MKKKLKFLIACKNCKHFIRNECKHPENNGSRYFCEEYDHFEIKSLKIGN